MPNRRALKTWTVDKPFTNLNWEKFCQLYAKDTEFFGNGVESYLEAFKQRKKGQRPLSYLVAKANASALLTKSNILERINYLLDLHINAQVVDKNLGIVILQNADYKAKVAAIREWNEMKKRVSRGNTNILIINAETKTKAKQAFQTLLD